MPGVDDAVTDVCQIVQLGPQILDRRYHLSDTQQCIRDRDGPDSVRGLLGVTGMTARGAAASRSPWLRSSSRATRRAWPLPAAQARSRHGAGGLPIPDQDAHGGPTAQTARPKIEAGRSGGLPARLLESRCRAFHSPSREPRLPKHTCADGPVSVKLRTGLRLAATHAVSNAAVPRRIKALGVHGGGSVLSRLGARRHALDANAATCPSLVAILVAI